VLLEKIRKREPDRVVFGHGTDRGQEYVFVAHGFSG
jgi:hypothetical protein